MNFLRTYIYNVKYSLNQPSDKSFVSERELGQNIPKIIHQVYTKLPLPTEFQANVDYLKNKNPHWTHRLYDDKAMVTYVEKEFPEIYSYFIRINPAYGACRVDLFRYLLIYNEGGAYFDIKSGAHKPLDEIIEGVDKYLLSHWPKSEATDGRYGGILNPNGELQQFHIIAVKGPPFLKAVIDAVCNNINRYNPLIHGSGGAVMVLSGPVVYTNVIYPLMSQYPCRLNYHKELGYREEMGINYSCLNGFVAHRKVYSKKHYSELKIPVINQSHFIIVLYKITYWIKKTILN